MNLKKEISEINATKNNGLYKIFDVNKKPQTILSNSSFEFGKSLHFHSSKVKNHYPQYTNSINEFGFKNNFKRNYQQFNEDDENDGIKTPLAKQKNSENIFKKDSFNPSNQILMNDKKNSLSFILNEPSELEISKMNSQFPVLSIYK